MPTGILIHLIMREGYFSSERYLTWLTNTIGLAGITAITGVVIAIGLAYAARMTRGKWHTLVNRAVSMGYAVPGAVLAVGILVLLGQFGLTWMLSGSVAVLVYAYLTRFLSSGLQTVEAGLTKITPNMDASAMSLGASQVEILRRVHIPLLRRSALTAGLLIFVDVMKELPATLVLRPFNTDTLAVMAYQLARDERLGEAALPSLALVVAGLLPVLLMARAQTK